MNNSNNVGVAEVFSKQNSPQHHLQQRSLQRSRDTRIYIALSAACLFIAVLGFGPGSVHRLITGDLRSPVIVHMHAAVYSLWLLLFLLQAVLVSRNRIDLHRRLGWFMAGYAVLMVALGVGVTVNRFVSQVQLGDIAQAQRVNLAPAIDMIIFPLVLLAAIALRRRSEFHKRLMVVATTGLLFAAVARMAFLNNVGYWAFVALWLSPIWLGMGYDLVVLRLVHPAYVVGLLLLLASALRYAAVESEWWQITSQQLVTWVQRHNG